MSCCIAIHGNDMANINFIIMKKQSVKMAYQWLHQSVKSIPWLENGRWPTVILYSVDVEELICHDISDGRVSSREGHTRSRDLT